MDKNNANSMIGDFITRNLKTIATCIVFLCGIYLQHQSSMIKIEQMERDLVQIRTQLEVQYAKLDNMKLDKAVFEATMKQFTDMSIDIRQIRDRLENVLEGNYLRGTSDANSYAKNR